MESYLLKSSLVMAILYLVYRLITHQEPNHQLNRFHGLAFLIFSVGFLLIPLEGLFISSETNEAIYVFIKGASDIQSNFNQVSSQDSIPIYLILYLIGFTFFSIRSIVGVGTLIYQFLKSSTYHRWGFTVVALQKDVSPFTFFNLLFIGKQRLEAGNLEVMLMHEQVHRDQFHSLDALFLEVLTLVFWFNPFIWLFQRDIKAEHEFQADAQVLEKGINKSDYQHFLFEARTGVSIQLGNYLSNKTSLSKRFNMMTNNKINIGMSYTRVGFSLFVMGFILFISACAVMDSQVDVPAEYEQGMSTMYKTMGQNLLYPKSAREEGSQGTVYVSFTVNENGDIADIVADKKNGYLLEAVVVVGYGSTEGAKKVPTDINEDIKAEVVRSTGLLGKFIPAQKDGNPVSSVLVLPIKYKLTQ